MTIEELKKYKWFVATCKYEGIVGKKHCFTYDVDNLNTNLLSGMILVDDELVKETEERVSGRTVFLMRFVMKKFKSYSNVQSQSFFTKKFQNMMSG